MGLFMHERYWFLLYLSMTFSLHSPRLAPCICMRMCVCVLATMRCRTRSTNERHAYEVKERERITAPFVVHHVERISFLSVFFLAFSSHFWCIFSLSLSDISSSSRARPTLTYREKSAYTHSHTHSNARSCVDPHIYKKKWRKAFGCLPRD